MHFCLITYAHTHTHGPSSYDRQHQQRKKQPQNTPSHKKENTQPHIKHDSNTPPSYIIKKKKNIQNRAIWKHSQASSDWD